MKNELMWVLCILVEEVISLGRLEKNYNSISIKQHVCFFSLDLVWIGHAYTEKEQHVFMDKRLKT